MERRDFIKKATLAAAGAAVVSPVSAMINGATEEKKCKVLLVNGSPRTDGNTFCCLKEIEATLQKHGVESEIVQIGRKPFCFRKSMPTAIPLPSATSAPHS